MLRTRTTIVILGVLTAAMLIYIGVTHPYYLPERGGGLLATIPDTLAHDP
jgi:hypothetical protein